MRPARRNDLEDIFLVMSGCNAAVGIRTRLSVSAPFGNHHKEIVSSFEGAVGDPGNHAPEGADVDFVLVLGLGKLHHRQEKCRKMLGPGGEVHRPNRQPANLVTLQLVQSLTLPVAE